ncbi:MAG TPA: efflux RND transporter periplasmic adaptor subunit [Chthoniobacterales bacterium]
MNLPPALRFSCCFIAISALLIAGCGRKPPATAVPLTDVTVVRPIEKEVQEWDGFTGRLEAPETVEIRARVSGYLESINFKDGSLVKKGDLLFVIDPRPYQAALNGAEASLKQAEAQRALAQTNLNRSQDLRKKNVVAQEELDNQINNYKVGEAQVASAQANLETARLNLDFTQVRAPVSGRVSRHYVSIGNLVGGGADTSTLLTTITSLDPIYAYFEVDEASFLKYQNMLTTKLKSTDPDLEDAAPDTPVELQLSNESAFDHKGQLDFIDNRLDRDTATVQLRGVFSNSDLKLTPGLFARVRIPGRDPGKAILLPDQAIGADQSQQYVMTVGPDNKAVYTKVELGPIVDGLRVIRKGLTTADRVVAIGMQRARPGLPLKPTEKSVDEIIGAQDPVPMNPGAVPGKNALSDRK